MALLHDSKNWYKVQWRATLLHKWLSSYFYVYFEGSPQGEGPRVFCQEVILPFFICSHVARGKKKRSHFMDVFSYFPYFCVLLRFKDTLRSLPQVALWPSLRRTRELPYHKMQNLLSKL
jgi:hypothetical protein